MADLLTLFEKTLGCYLLAIVLFYAVRVIKKALEMAG